MSESPNARAEAERIAVIGAGVVGLATALKLRRLGHRVTLYDPEPPGSMTSFGNAALIATSFVVPLAMPGFWKQIPEMLLDPLGPLAFRWGHMPSMLPWFLKILRASTPREVDRIAAMLVALVGRSIEAWQTLLGAESSARLLKREGVLQVFRDPRKLAAMETEVALQRRHGVRVERIAAAELPQFEPALARDLLDALFYPDVAHCIDPATLSAELASAFAREGGELQKLRVRQIEMDADGRPTIVGEAASERADRAIITAGIWSKALVEPLGTRVALESERGYHLMLPQPRVQLRRPVRAGDHRFVMTPLAGGLRLAGTAEFAGLDAPPNWRRADLFLEPARALLPGLDGRDAVRWMGHRPSSPDSLPIIGALPGLPRIICAFGHGHLGLTLGAVTAEIVAALTSRRPPPVDIAPLRPGRF
ncbi:MAG: FAD-dependent oxidoreductase [Alphaproteobacteria bacterium]